MLILWISRKSNLKDISTRSEMRIPKLNSCRGVFELFLTYLKISEKKEKRTEIVLVRNIRSRSYKKKKKNSELFNKIFFWHILKKKNIKILVHWTTFITWRKNVTPFDISTALLFSDITKLEKFSLRTTPTYFYYTKFLNSSSFSSFQLTLWKFSNNAKELEKIIQ